MITETESNMQSFEKCSITTKNLCVL